MVPLSAAPGEIEALLAPIDAANPVGRSLRDSPELRDLRLARGEDSAPRTARSAPARETNWRAIAAQAQLLLREQGKDVEVACRLAEAWSRLQGLEGLARGLTLIAGLVERYGKVLSRRDGDEQASDWWAEYAARLKWLDLVLPPELRAVGDTVSPEWIRQQLDALELVKASLGRLCAVGSVGQPMARLYARLDELCVELDELRERALTELQWFEEQRQRQRQLNQMNAGKRQALREREQAVRALHGVVQWLQREQPGSVAELLVERALRLMHEPPERLRQQLERLATWTTGDELPCPTVFDDPPPGQG